MQKYGKTSQVFLVRLKIRTIDSYNIIKYEEKVTFYAEVTEEEIPSLVKRDLKDAKIKSISQIKLGHLYNINNP